MQICDIFGHQGLQNASVIRVYYQTRSIDHKNIMMLNNQTAEAVITTNLLRDIFLRHLVHPHLFFISSLSIHFLSKHLKGWLGPCVSDVTFFGSMEVGWGSVLVT